MRRIGKLVDHSRSRIAHQQEEKGQKEAVILPICFSNEKGKKQAQHRDYKRADHDGKIDKATNAHHTPPSLLIGYRRLASIFRTASTVIGLSR